MENTNDKSLESLNLELLEKNRQLADEIRALKHKNKNYKDQSELFRTIAEHSQDIILRIDKNYKPVYTNFTGIKTFEKSKERQQSNLIEPFSINYLEKAFEKVFRTEEPCRIESRLDDAWIDWLCVPEKSEQGDVTTILVVGRDISDIKNVETAFQNSEVRFRAFADSSKSAMFIIQKDRFIYFNQAMEEISGYGKHDLLSLKFQDLLAPAMKNIIKERAKARMEGIDISSRYEVAFINKDGREKWADLSVTEFEYQGKYSIFGTAFDITESRRAKEALRESEARYRNILESIEEIYFEVDLAGNLVFFNDALTRAIGLARSELMGMNNREYTTPETAKKMYRAFNDVYETGVPAIISNYEIINNNGMKKVLELSAYLMKDNEGRPVGFRGVARDTSKMLKAEKEKKELEKQLEQALRMEAIGTLAGGIAHDFNNLLTSIQGNCSILKLRTEQDSSNYEKLHRIDELVQSGADLTRQLLGFAMGGKYEVRPTILNKLIAKTLKMIDRTKKEITIHENFEENLWKVEVDRGQIEQVLINLYVNASHAMPRGGELFVKTENVDIRNEAASSLGIEPGSYVKILIRDTGIGMDKKTMNRIFEPFFTTKEMGRGTGLGLASAYGIINNHKGRIIVKSKKGRGTSFDIFLPASDKDDILNESPRGEILTGKGTIMLVDDEEIIGDVSKEILEEIGYDVIYAESGKKALEIYREGSDTIDLVILDMIMPGMGGEDTYRALVKINPRARILLSSGYSRNDMINKIVEENHCDFIQKPFNMHSLSRAVKKALDLEEIIK